MDKRLKKIAEVVGKKNKIIDVGTDHGYLPIFLVEEGFVCEAIVSDISKDSLRKAEILIGEKRLGHRITSRLGSGLEVLSNTDKVETAVIAGMGGNLIAKILEKNRHLIREGNMILVLQPMQNPEVLRRYLLKGGYIISGEYLTQEDGRIYQIIEARIGEDESVYSEIELEFGKKKNYSPEEAILYSQLLINKRKEIDSIIHHIKQSESKRQKELLKIYYQKIGEIEEIEGEI